MHDDFVSKPLEVQVPRPVDSLETYDVNAPLSSNVIIPSSSDYATASNLEVHAPSTQSVANQPIHKSFSKRKAITVSAVITGLVMLLTGTSALLLGKNAPKNSKATLNVPVQFVGLEDSTNASLPSELRGASEAFFVSADIITNGDLKFSNNSFISVITTANLTANQKFIIPDASGTLCLDTNNCDYTGLDLFNQLTGQVNTLSQRLGQIQVPAVPASSIVNNQTGAVTIQGTSNQVIVSTNNGVITVSAAQDLAQLSSPTFAGLVLNGGLTTSGTITLPLNCSALLNGGSLTTNGSGQVVCSADDGGAGGGNVTSTGGTPGAIAYFDAAQNIQDSLLSQALGTVTVGGGLTITGAISGNSLTLTTDLSVPNGGTGTGSFTADGLLLGNGVGAVTTTNAAANAQILLGNGTTPTFTSLSGDIAITAAGLTTIQADSITLGVDTTGNYLEDISVGNGLTLGGAAGEGATRSISLNAQANKGLEVDVNGLSLIDCGINQVLKYNGLNQWACSSDTDTTGSFSLAGTSGTPETVNNGDTVTIAAGNNITTTAGATDTVTVATVNNPTFNTSVSTPLLQSSGALSITPTGALTVGATSQTALLQGSTTTITSTGAGNDIVLTPADRVRISTLDCTGFANGGVLTTDASGNISCADDNGDAASGITGTGTANRVAIFTGANTVADSWLLQNGSTIDIDNGRNLNLIGGNFTVTGTGTYSGLITANGSLTIEAGDTFTFNGDAFTDFTGTGLQISTGSLQTTLGTSVDLTTEVTGILPVGNGGTGVNGAAATNGQLLIGNGTGYTLATISQGTGVTITNGAGTITVASTLGASIESSEITDLTVTGADIADDTITLGTKTTGNYIATIAGSAQIDVSGSGSETAAATLSLVADSIGDTQLAFNTGQNLTTTSSPTFGGLTLSGTLAVQGASATIGGAAQAGSLILHDGTGETATISSANQAANRTLTIPTVGSNADFCLSTGNCASAGGGVTGAGTNNKLAKYTATGNVIGDSTITDDGTNVTTSVDLIVQGGAVNIGTALQDGALTLYGNGFTAAISATLTGNQTFGLPDGSGEFCIKEVGNCSGAGGGNAPNSAQYLTLALDAGLSAERTLSFNGTNFSVVDNGANNSYTVNTAQNINTTATPSFAGLTLTGNLNMNANTLQGTTAVIDFTNFDVSSAGLVTAGTYNGQTISNSTSFTGTLGVTGLTTLNGGLTIEAGDTLTFNGDAFTDLTGNGLQVTTNVLTLLVQANKGLEVDGSGLSLIDCSDGQVLKYNGSNQWACAADGTGADGDSISVNGVAVTDADFISTTASGTVAGTTFILNNVANPDEITLTVSAASDTVAGVITTGAQTFAGVKTFNGQIVAADGIDLGADILIGTTAVINFTNFDVSSAGAVTAVGVNAGAGLIQGASGLTVSGTVTLSSLDCTGFANGGALTTNGSGVVSCSADDGGGAAPTLQITYDNDADGSNAVVTLTSTDGAILFRDNATPLSGTLFAVQNDDGTTSYLTVSATGVSVTGTGTFSGAIAANGGVNLAAQTLSGTTAVIDFNNFDVSSAGAVVAVGVNAGSGLLQGTGGLTISGTTTLSSLTNGFLEVNGSGVVSVGTIDLGNDTTGNYVATITNGNGVSGTATGEGSTPTLALSNLTADWLQSGAFDIVLDNSASELKIRESTGAFYAIFDVADLTADQTFTLNEGGTVVTSGNVATYATTGVTAGTGLTGGGTVGVLTLNIASANGGIVANANDIALTLQVNKGLEVDANGLSLIDCANNEILKYETTGNTWVCGADAGAAGTGDDVSVNGTAATNANFLNAAASGTSASTTWSLATASNPDDITLVIGNASATDAGAVTTGAQTFGGAKTFASTVVIQGASATIGTTSVAGSLLLHDGNGQKTTISAGDSVADIAFILPTTVGSSSQCLKNSATAGTLTFANCNNGSGGGGAITLQDAYDAGNNVTLTDARDVTFTLANTATDSNYLINIATSSTGKFAVQNNGTDELMVNSSGTTIGTLTLINDLTVANGGTGAGSFTSNGILYGNGTGAIQVTAAGTTGQCLLANTGAAPAWAACTANGSFTAAGTSGTNQTISSGDTFTIAAGTNITTTGGATDTVTVATVANPSFATSVTTPSITNTAALTVNATSAALTLQTTTSGNVVLNSAGGTIELQDATNVTGNFTATGTGLFSGASVTIGAAALQGSLILNDGNGGQTATIQVGNLAGSTVLTLPSTLGATDTFCFLTLANCSGSATTLQQSYTADVDGSDAVIALTTADDSLIIRNPSSSGTDSGYVALFDQLNTGNVDGVRINNAGTGDILQLQDNGTTVARFADGGHLLGANSATGTTGTTEATARTNVTTVTLTAAGSFANNDIIFINNAGQDYYTRIVSGGGTTTLTISPAVSYDASANVTKYIAQNIGATATDYTTLTNRLFQGYFLGGVVTGAGSTTLSDGNLRSTGSLVLQGTGGNVGIGDTTPTALFTVGNGDLFKVDSGGNTMGNSSLVPINNQIAVVGSYSGPYSWDASNTLKNVNVSTAIPAATTGDMLVLMVYMGASGNSPPATMDVPAGFTQRLNGNNNSTLIGVFTAPYVSSFNFQAYANVNTRYTLMAVRNHDGATPVVTATDAANFTNTNDYPTMTEPLSGRTGLLITGINRSDNSGSDLGAYPKPGNINDASTIAIPPTAQTYVNSWTHHRLYNSPAGGSVNPGDVGGTSTWTRMFSMMLQSPANTNTTEAVARSNVTTVTTSGVVSTFANNDIIYINNAGQDYYTRIVSGAGTTTLTVSPAVSYDASAPLTEYLVQNIGASNSDYSTQSNRYFQGYFLGGVVTGNTTLSEGALSSSGNLVLQGAGGNVGIGTASFGTNNKLIVNPYSTLDNLATVQINTTSATNKGLVLQAYTAQSADLLQIQDSSGNVNAKINSGGNVFTLGRGSANSGQLVLNNSANNNTVTLTAGTAASTNYTLTLPSNDGNSGDCIVSDGSGNLSFSSTCSSAGAAGIIDYAVNETSRTYTANGTWEDVGGTSITFNAANTGNYLVNVSMQVRGASANWLDIKHRVLLDGATTSVTPSEYQRYVNSNVNTSEYHLFSFQFVLANISSGTHTIKLQTHDDSSNLDREYQRTSVVILGSTGNGSTLTAQNTYENSIGGATPEIKLNSTQGGFDIQDANTTLGSTVNLFAVRGSNAGGLGSALFNVQGNGNVGIGTTTPLGLLHVNKSGGTLGYTPSQTDFIFQDNSTVGSSANLFLLSGNTGQSKINLGDTDAEASGLILYDHISNYLSLSTNDSERLRILSDGSVGIGTTTTGLARQVNAVSSSATTLYQNTAGALGLVNTDQTNNNWVYIYFGDDVADNAGAAIGTRILDHTTNYSEMRFATRDVSGLTDRLTIQSGGNVGIGTTAPSHRLTVKATGDADGIKLLASDDAIIARLEESSIGGAFFALEDTNSVNTIELHTSGNSYFNGGNVGIGDTTPDAQLDIDSTFTNSNVFGIATSTITSGDLINIQNTSGLSTGSDMYFGLHQATYTTTATNNGSLLELNRNLTTNVGGVLTQAGDLVRLISNCTVTAGSCTDNSSVLDILQDYASSSGDVINVLGDGTGNLAVLDATNTSANGVSIDIQSSSSSQYALDVRSGNGTSRLYVRADGNVGIGDSTPAHLLTIGNGDLFGVNSEGSVLAKNSATGTTGTTEATARTNVTNITLTTDAFNVNDVIFFNNAGQDYYARITVDNADGTYTVTPAVSYDVSITVTKYNIQNIGATATDYTTQSNRYFQGYFLGGVVAGAGSTTLSDGNLQSTNTLNIQSNSNTTIFGGDVVVATGKTLRVIGDTTANRPGSPTEGTIYYDTTTKQLLTYDNGKWQADRSTATKVVAANNSSQAQKDAADYVADGTADQVEINAALTAAAGGKVYLMEGTYVANATILVPNNTMVVGAGRGTLIELADLDATDNLIENSDTTTGTGVIIQDLILDGRKDLNTAGTQAGIYFNNMGGGSGSSARQGGKISGLFIKNFKTYGLRLEGSSNNQISDNTLFANSNGVSLGSFSPKSSHNVIANNHFQANTSYGLYVYFSDNNNIVGNTGQGNTGQATFGIEGGQGNNVTGNTDNGSATGILLNNIADNNTLTGNTIKGSSSYGITLSSSDYNTVSSNTISSAGGAGISLNMGGSQYNNIISNTINDSGGAANNNGIQINNASYNSINNNAITDSSATTTNYAISIINSTSTSNVFTYNRLGTGTINDLGTTTTYHGQMNSSGEFIFPSNNIGIGNIDPDTTLEITGGVCVSDNIADDCTTAAGTIRADGAITANAFDLAERYGSHSHIPVGTIVSVDTATDRYVKVALPDETAIGIVSTNPGLVLGWEDNTELDGAAFKPVIALAGRVPVRVSLENGVVKRGDAIALSKHQPGVGVKATKAGNIIGHALSEYNGDGEPFITVFIKVGYYTPPISDMLQADSASIGDLQVAGTANIATLNVSGIATINKLVVVSDVQIGGKLVVTGDAEFANIFVNGRLISRGDKPDVTKGVAAGQDGAAEVLGTTTAGTIKIIAKAATTTPSGLGEVLIRGELARLKIPNGFDGRTPNIAITAANESAAGIRIFYEIEGDEIVLKTLDALETNQNYMFSYIIVESTAKN